MRTRTALFVSAIALLLGLAAARGGELAVRLTVNEPAGAARKGAPACGGVPLPWGAFKKDQPFAVFAGGREVPAQVLPLVVDEKGYLRWVLVDVQVDLAAKGKQELVLKAAKPAARPAGALKVIEAADGVTVETGKITFVISKNKPFGLFSSVSAGGKPVIAGGGAGYTDVTKGEKRYTADKPTSIVVEYRGSMRTTVCVRGRFVGDEKSKLGCVARVTAWAGRSDVHVKYSLASSNPKHYCYRQIADSSVRLKLAGKLTGEAAPAGEWILAKTAAGNVSAADLYFKEDPPRKLAVEGGALVLAGVEKGPRWLFDCSHLSSQYVIDFAATPGGGAQKASAARGWLHLRCEPSWYSETGGLSIGRFGSQADERKCYDAWKWKYDARRAPRAPRGRSVRVVRYKRVEDNHYETEQDNVECFLLMYLRTGAEPYRTMCQAWANYEMDLQKWRTDGWRWKDGGVWWRGGPYGNRPQRANDPVHNRRSLKCGPLGISKQCYCHTYGAGLAGWFCITGERDALEAAVDGVEQNHDTQKRARGKTPGKTDGARSFGRDFCRSARVANAVRLAAPTDKFVVEASDYLSAVYLKRPNPEPRGFVPAPAPVKLRKVKNLSAGIAKLVGERGMAGLKKHGVTMDPGSGQLTHAQTGTKWFPVQDPQFYHYAPLPAAMEDYWRAAGSEDARDWVVAMGQGFARVIYQPHGNFAGYHSALLVDFPARGIALDRLSWNLDDGNKWAEGPSMSGYTARFWPDAPARAYDLTGEKLLKQRAYDYWFAGSHRGYRATKMHNLGGVGTWVNVYGVHAECVRYTARTFYVHSHPRKDADAPAAVKDLQVTLAGEKATVSFSAPADAGGGKVARYQVKCATKPIVDYVGFLKLWKGYKSDGATNWWMAANLKGEPGPKAPGSRESFTVTGVPEGARFFAVRSYDDSSNRSAMSNVAGTR